MITVELARRLASGGVLWEPRPGDRFAIDQPELASEVFWISELTIDVHTHQGQPILGFNGTTEWALDSVSLDKAIWLPREDQLRDLLGDRFMRLARHDDRWVVTIRDGTHVRAFGSSDTECAYAEALLALL